MGSIDFEIWECKACGYVFKGESGLYEADPCDMGTLHGITPYYCPYCHNLENLSEYIGFKPEEEGNEELCHTDSDVCKKCGTKMQILKPPKDKTLQEKRVCPMCNKKELVFKELIENALIT